MSAYSVELMQIIMPDYSSKIAEYWNRRMRHIPLFLGSHVKLRRAGTFRVRDGDSPETFGAQYISVPHLRTMQMIPLRLLALQGIHTTFSTDEVRGCLSAFNEEVEAEIELRGKGGVIAGASKFRTGNGEAVGTLVIPYNHSLPRHERDNPDAYEKAMAARGMPNITLRTNDERCKYTRMCTNVYNGRMSDRLVARMPFVPIVCVNSQTEYINRLCIMNGVLERLRLAESPEARRYASEIMDLADKSSAKFPPIYMIEGEKKALSLQAAIDCQYESMLYRAMLAYSMDGSKSFKGIEAGLEKAEYAEVVGVSGVWQTEKKSDALIGDLQSSVDFNGRDVCICYDRDLQEKGAIVHAMGVLNLGLKRAGAKSVKMAAPDLPEELSQLDWKKCKGFDDTVEQACLFSDGSDAYEKMLNAYDIALRGLRESFVPMRSDYTRKSLKAEIAPFYGENPPKYSAAYMVAEVPVPIQAGINCKKPGIGL